MAATPGCSRLSNGINGRLTGRELRLETKGRILVSRAEQRGLHVLHCTDNNHLTEWAIFIPGLFFYFDGSEGDYCSEIVITWYNDTEQLATKTFTPNSYKYFCEQQVDLYNKLVVQINKTHLPNHYAKISQIFFGIVREFERGELRSVRVTEGMNIISDDLEINTLDFSLDSADDIGYVFSRSSPSARMTQTT